MIKTIKQHASEIAEKVARGATPREEYSNVVRDCDLTLGECSALRNEIELAIHSRLRDLQKLADSLRIG